MVGDEGYISIDGKITAIKDGHIPPLDRSWLFGDRLIETMVGYGDRLWNFASHQKRLRLSAKKLGFSIPWSDEDLKQECQRLLQHLQVPKAFVRLMISRGEGFGLWPSKHSPHRYIYALKAMAVEKAIYSRGLHLLSCKTTWGSVTGHKTGYYLPAITALQALDDTKADDILWLASPTNCGDVLASKQHYHILESSSAHIVCIDKGSIIIPGLEEWGIFPGITVAEIKDICRLDGIEVAEKFITYEEFLSMNGCFLCSSVRGLVPVSKVDDISFL